MKVSCSIKYYKTYEIMDTIDMNDFNQVKEKMASLGLGITEDNEEDFARNLNSGLKKHFGKLLRELKEDDTVVEPKKEIIRNVSESESEDESENEAQPAYIISKVNIERRSMSIKFVCVKGILQCPCGSRINRKGQTKHNKTKKHQMWFDNYIDNYSK